MLTKILATIGVTRAAQNLRSIWGAKRHDAYPRAKRDWAEAVRSRSPRRATARQRCNFLSEDSSFSGQGGGPKLRIHSSLELRTACHDGKVKHLARVRESEIFDAGTCVPRFDGPRCAGKNF